MLTKSKLLVTSVGVIFLILISGFIGVHLAKAVPSATLENLKTVATPSYEEVTKDTLFSNIASIIKTILELLGFIFVILMIYAGILWMTAGGNEKQVEKAKNIISRAAIGLIIIVSAYAITYFIFANLPGGAIGVAN